MKNSITNQFKIIVRTGFKVMLLALITTVTFNSTAKAGWDGQRKGFLLGIGFGAGYDSYSGVQYDLISARSKDNSTFAFAASPRIGYAFNNRMAFFYSRHPFVFSVENDQQKDITITSCIEALQVHYYLSDASPSLYLGLGGGIGYFFDDKTSNYSKDALKGIGLIGTVGYEPIKHVSTELSLHFKSPQDGASDFGVSLLVTILGY